MCGKIATAILTSVQTCSCSQRQQFIFRCRAHNWHIWFQSRLTDSEEPRARAKPTFYRAPKTAQVENVFTRRSLSVMVSVHVWVLKEIVPRLCFVHIDALILICGSRIADLEPHPRLSDPDSDQLHISDLDSGPAPQFISWLCADFLTPIRILCPKPTFSIHALNIVIIQQYYYKKDDEVFFTAFHHRLYRVRRYLNGRIRVGGKYKPNPQHSCWNVIVNELTRTYDRQMIQNYYYECCYVAFLVKMCCIDNL